MCRTNISLAWSPAGVDARRSSAARLAGQALEGEFSVEKLEDAVEELRERCAAAEQRIRDSSSVPPAVMAPQADAPLQNLRQAVDQLQLAVERKQRTTQALRLQISFSTVHELSIQEKQSLVHCMSLRRQLAAIDPEAFDTTLGAASKLGILDSGGGNGGDNCVDGGGSGDGGGAMADGWSELSAFVAGAAAEVDSLELQVADPLEALSAAPSEAVAVKANSEAGAQADEHGELLRQVEDAKAELAKLRDAHESAGSAKADGEALRQSLKRLQEEVSGLLDAKSTLEAEIDELQRELARSKVAPWSRAAAT